MNSPRHVILDMDGVLIDSLPIAKQTYLELLLTHGHVGTDTEFDELNGPTLREVCLRLISRYRLDVEPDALLDQYQSTFSHNYRGVRLNPGARQLLDGLVGKRIRVSLASSAPRHLISQVLDSLGLEETFTLVVSGEDVNRGKPAPDLFLLVRDRFPEDEFIVVEDSPAGIAAARAANMRVVHYAPRGLSDGTAYITHLRQVLDEV